MPYFPPGGGGGGSGTPGGSDSQVQVNSQNAFAGFPNLRWIGSSNELNLNSAGRIRKGGVAEVDGVAPAGVTGLIWLDTSASSFTSSSAGLAGTGGLFVVTSASPLLPSSRILTAGSSVTITTDTTAIYITALTNAGGGITKDQNYFMQANTLNFVSATRNPRYYVAGLNGGDTITQNNFLANSMIFMPIVITKNIMVDSMMCRVVTGGSATTTVQLGIYTNSADNILFPFNSIATSGFLTGSNSGVVDAFNPAITLSANNLYWLGVSVAIGSVALSGFPVASMYPMLGIDAAFGAGGLGIIFGIAGGSLPSVMPGSGSVFGQQTPPALFIRLSA